MKGADVVPPSSSLPAYASVSPARPPTHPYEHTKIKVSPLTGLQMEKNMFFVMPEMPSKTFVMLYKKLSDNFKYTEVL